MPQAVGQTAEHRKGRRQPALPHGAGTWNHQALHGVRREGAAFGLACLGQTQCVAGRHDIDARGIPITGQRLQDGQHLGRVSTRSEHSRYAQWTSRARGWAPPCKDAPQAQGHQGPPDKWPHFVVGCE